MKKVSLIFLFLVLASFHAHRFYVGMFQLKFVPQKKELQITTRVFIDDLNEALQKEFKTKTAIGENNESKQDLAFMLHYFKKKFKLNLNGKNYDYLFLSKEINDNSLICYFKIKEIKQIKTLQIENSILTEIFSDQQNIIQFENNGKKSSLLLSGDTLKGMLN